MSRQTNRFDGFRNRNSFVESQQGYIVVEVSQTELIGNGSKHEPGLGPHRRVAAVVLTKCNLYHEPHKAENKTM